MVGFLSLGASKLGYRLCGIREIFWHDWQRRRMALDSDSVQKSLGFVSIRHRPDQGYYGGYLLVNGNARPLEFHCTVPVQPTRAQSILFGPTLEEFLCGEQIARALLSRAKLDPQVVLVDCAAALCARHWIDLPILWLKSLDKGGASELAESQHGFETPEFQRIESQYVSGNLPGYSFTCLEAYRSDLEALGWLTDSKMIEIELDEPFERIVEALSEAHPRAKAG